ncbi:TAXI family TRAP transporter solute-binding subunit [Rhodoplanes azumiensis]|uniref:TAXI family TRAP transporter solute-binding subunit n=1 Tax=Rhodoplanes azumiensis TaxID=1897628 RepID=A0ABW5AJ68_9BRAD
MDHGQFQKVAGVAAGAAVVAGIAAVATGRLPRWLRITVVLGVTMLAVAGGLWGWRYVTAPKTLTVATGSLGGETPKVVTALAARLAAAKAPVRLQVIDKGSVLDATEAFSSGEVDLVVGRSDVGDLGDARAVVVVSNIVVLLVTPPGSKITEIAELKGKTVGVISGPVNRAVVAALEREYDLDHLKVTFRDLVVTDAPAAVASKQVAAILVVMPLTEKYLTLLRSLFPTSRQSPGLIPIEAAGAIAAVSRAFESYDVPKGTLRGSPPVPDDDLTTLRVPVHLLIRKTVDEDTVAALAKAIMDVRRDLVGEYPLLAQIAAPSTDSDAFVPIHPGAAAYFDGDVKTFFDKWGDQIFYGSMLLGGLTSVAAAAWRFMARDLGREINALAGLRGFSERIEAAADEPALTGIERQIDAILHAELDRIATRDPDAADPAALSLAIHRLERLIARRRAALAGTPPAAPSGPPPGSTTADTAGPAVAEPQHA